MKEPLAPQQKKLFEFIKKEIEKNGRPPTRKEAAAHLGISASAVHVYLRTIEEKGWVELTWERSRNIIIK